MIIKQQTPFALTQIKKGIALYSSPSSRFSHLGSEIEEERNNEGQTCLSLLVAPQIKNRITFIISFSLETLLFFRDTTFIYLVI
jgi:hypothetical protein